MVTLVTLMTKNSQKDSRDSELKYRSFFVVNDNSFAIGRTAYLLFLEINDYQSPSHTLQKHHKSLPKR